MAIKEEIEKLLIELKINGIDRDRIVHFHQARHTFAYLSKQKNVSTDVIKDALGHSNYATTKGYLKSLSDDHINDALRDVYQ